MTAAERLLSADVFQDQTFADLALEAAELSGKDFLRCTFRGAKLPQSRWEGDRLEDCLFEDCDLSRLRPAPRTLSGVVFRRSKLMGVEWSRIPNPAVSFEECDLRYGAFLDMVLKGAQLKGCKAAEGTFSGCDLTRADFTGTDL